MDIITLLKRDAFNIEVDTKNDIFIVNLVEDVEYNEKGFQEFLEYFR